MDKFKINNLEFEYCKHSYNTAYRNERTVEVPLGTLALSILEKLGPTVEVGAVLPYYLTDTKHEVIDYYDPWPYCIKADVITSDFSGINVLSISTVEHIGTADYGNKNINDSLAFEVLNRIYNQSLSYFVTFPLGLHGALQNSVLQSAIPHFIVKRLDAGNHWQLHNDCNDFNFRYDNPFNNANAICVLTNLKEFYA